MGKAKYIIMPGDKIKVKATGEYLTVIARTTTGVYAMHKSPLNTPSKNAKYFEYREIENVSVSYPTK